MPALMQTAPISALKQTSPSCPAHPQADTGALGPEPDVNRLIWRRTCLQGVLFLGFRPREPLGQ